MRGTRRSVAAGRYAEAAVGLTNWLTAGARFAQRPICSKGRVAVASNSLNEAAGEVETGAVARPCAPGPGVAPGPDRHEGGSARRGRARTETFVRGAPSRRPADRRGAGESVSRNLQPARAAAVLEAWARDFPDDAKPHLLVGRGSQPGRKQNGMVENDYREVLRAIRRCVCPPRPGG